MPTPAPDINLSSLQQIRTKVRRLTRSLSPAQLSDADIDAYVNTFVLYDFPESIRLFDLHSTLTFYTEPGVDVYSTNTTVPTSPLYNFNNIYLTVNPPAYCAGYILNFAQSRTQFYATWPKTNFIKSIGVSGDGFTATFAGVINTQQGQQPQVQQNIHLLQNQVLFDSIDINGNGLTMTDYPISNTIGNLRTPDAAPTSTIAQDVNNYINYNTGQFVVTFPFAPDAGSIINSQTVLYVPNRPQSILFFQDSFVLRPVPDQPYRIEIEVDKRPDYLLAGNTPEISQWWQYIAYGASKKVFEDRNDLDSVQLIMPEFKQQELLVLRKTIVQQSTQRTSTIFSDLGGIGPSGFGWGNNGWTGF
jgi:hypothetical protein